MQNTVTSYSNSFEGTVRKTLLHRKIRDEHGPHHVRPRHMARGLEIWMEISRDVQSPQALRPRIPTRVQGLVLRPPSCSGAAASDTRFHVEGTVPVFRNPSHEDAVPEFAVTLLGEHRCIAFVFGPLPRTQPARRGHRTR